MLKICDLMFLQQMLAAPFKTLTQSQDLLARINEQLSNEGTQDEAVDVEATISRINREIRHQYLLLALGRCEVTGTKCVSLISLQRDANLVDTHFTKADCSYWMQLMHEVVRSDAKSLQRIECLNIAKRSDSALPLERAEDFLATCLQRGYLVETNGRYFLGARALHEFVHDLRSRYADYVQMCELCSEICCFGTTCAKCGKLMHTYCAQDIINAEKECPLCEERWDDIETDNNDDEAESSTVKRRTRSKRLRASS